jgi:hypothetical protein
MAAKKGKKAAKSMGKKEMKRTKGGVLIGLTQADFVIKGETPTIAPTQLKL